MKLYKKRSFKVIVTFLLFLVIACGIYPLYQGYKYGEISVPPDAISREQMILISENYEKLLASGFFTQISQSPVCELTWRRNDENAPLPMLRILIHPTAEGVRGYEIYRDSAITSDFDALLQNETLSFPLWESHFERWNISPYFWLKEDYGKVVSHVNIYSPECVIIMQNRNTKNASWEPFGKALDIIIDLCQ